MNRAVRSLMRIQYASDLHLEFRGDKMPFPLLLKPVAPLLALAGDIGWPCDRIYRDFLSYCSRNWEAVFVVAGNHEYYNRRTAGSWRYSAPDTVSQRLSACQFVAGEFPNVHFLERQSKIWNGVVFLGCTLWSDLSDPAAANTAASMMSDYARIAITDENSGIVRAAMPADVTAWWRRDRAWLESEIDACADAGWPVVVITHHLPTFDLVSVEYAGSPLNPAFASACDYLIRPPVRAFIAGHTHTAATRLWGVGEPTPIFGCINPLGYPGENMKSGYCREIFVDIRTEATDKEPCDPLMVAAASATDEQLK